MTGIEPGHARRLGAHVEGDGVNFSVFSANAERIEVCLFDPESGRETRRFVLPERTGDVWHGFHPGLGSGIHYGLRAHGPWRPREGHRFNPAKLLIDPWARELSGPVRFHAAQLGHDVASARGTPVRDVVDSAPHVPRCVVLPPDAVATREADGPRTSSGDTVIWEVHVRGLTMERAGVSPAIRGTFDALGEPWLLDHLGRLGVTAVELMPVHSFCDESFLLRRGLSNYWGYNSLNFFVPEWRYRGPRGRAGFRTMVERFHAAGIEVILDVVYNHTAEGDERGPTLSYRGLDNASYYLLEDGAPDRYVNDTGCGNTLAVRRPQVLRLVLDSLRYWAGLGVDGFRFDLATALAREATGFDPEGGFMDALRQDPQLAECRLIAEPWDVGPGGYQAGAFPAEFAEWNDGYRDAARRYWLGEPGATRDLAHALLGSSRRFDRPGSRPTRSVNYVTAHDGFTLADLTRYATRRNEANGEGNRDGHSENHADGCGVDGPTADPAIVAARRQRQRNLLFTLFVSQGTPMLLAGDEWGNSQGGNNNAYCQDNPTGWLNWGDFDDELFAFTCRLAALRRAHPALRQDRYLHGEARPGDGLPDVQWFSFDGGEPDWRDAEPGTLALQVRTAAGPEAAGDDTVLIALNAAHADACLTLPPSPEGQAWIRAVDTAAPTLDAMPVDGDRGRVSGASGVVFVPGRPT